MPSVKVQLSNSTFLIQGSGNIMEEEQKEYKNCQMGKNLSNHSSYGYQHKIYTRSSLSKVLQLRVESLEKDGWLLIVNEEERVTLFWGHGLLLGGPCPSGWPHTHAHMGKTNCLGGYYNKT